jgi:hypothetical protein
MLKYGQEPPPRAVYAPHSEAAGDTFRAEITSLFERYDPSMLPLVPLLCADPSIARTEFIRDARSKYGAVVETRRLSPDLTAHTHFTTAGSSAGPVGGTLQALLRSPSPEQRSQGVNQSFPHHNQSFGAGGGGTGASREELEEAVKQLVAALDAKTEELEALAARLEQVTGDRDMLESKHSELSERATDLDLQNARLRELVKKHDAAQARRAEDSARAAQLETELAASQQRAAQAASTVAVREHQNRVLRIHLQQLSEELHAKDAKIKAVLQDKQALADSLAERLKDVAALQLDLTPSSDPEQFYSVVEDIQAAFRAHYDERIASDESEMREYFGYAEKQIGNREAIVDELLDALAATLKPTAAPPKR